jgi:hypothetical protein
VNLAGHSMGGWWPEPGRAPQLAGVKKLIVTDAVGIGDKANFSVTPCPKKIIGPRPGGNPGRIFEE